MYVFRTLAATSWFRALDDLQGALALGDAGAVQDAYTALYAALAASGLPDLETAAARGLLYLDSSLAQAAIALEEIPAGLSDGARDDLQRLQGLLARDWRREVCELLGRRVPPLAELAPPGEDALAIGANADAALAALVARYRQDGAGLLARFRAFRWAGHLEGVAHPAEPELTRLVGLARLLAQLTGNTETFLGCKPAQHTLLYGPRGSGKSTAVRGLLPRYAARGLRLVELPVAHLADLLRVAEHLRGRPHRYILFVDDLSFGENSAAYAPLKTLLEGSLTGRPDNLLVYATSNRRHLVSERFSDRPDPFSPSSEDVHAWDTQHERLALADRFGLTLTFPGAAQSRYLEIVRGLAAREGLEVADPDLLDAQAIRFAEWGNGYSGRTAQQFIERQLSRLT